MWANRLKSTNITGEEGQMLQHRVWAEIVEALRGQGEAVERYT